MRAPLHAQDAGQWGFYSASKGATRYSPLAQIDESNVARLRVAWRHKQADPAILAANPDFASDQPLHGHADLRRRPAVRAERLRARGGHRSEDRPHGSGRRSR